MVTEHVTEAELTAWERLASKETMSIADGLAGLGALHIMLSAYRSLAARLGEAESNLKKYGRHRDDCYWWSSCTCGLAAALAPGAGGGEEAT